jgi:hypothetical protein
MAIPEIFVDLVWQKGQVVLGNDPAFWRKDSCGAWIGKQFYGSRNSPYGWEIDHIRPVSSGGGDELPNLRPLQWENNAHRQNGWLACKVVSVGTQNVSA